MKTSQPLPPGQAFYENRVSNEAPAVLNQITDIVLAYCPKPKSKGAKRRVRKAKKNATS